MRAGLTVRHYFMQPAEIIACLGTLCLYLQLLDPLDGSHLLQIHGHYLDRVVLTGSPIWFHG